MALEGLFKNAPNKKVIGGCDVTDILDNMVFANRLHKKVQYSKKVRT